MGEVIRFPDDSVAMHASRATAAGGEPATVIILPVIRIERDPDGSEGQTHSGNGAGRRRRRRVAR